MQDILSALPTLLDMQGDNDEVRRSVVFSVWRRIAGESLLDHAVPVDLQNEKLIVAVADRNWQRNIEQLAGEMVFKMNFALGSRIVTFIEFVIDKSRFEDSMRKRPDRAESEAEALDRIDEPLRQAADMIQNDDLRRKLLLAAGSCLARAERMGLK